MPIEIIDEEQKWEAQEPEDLRSLRQKNEAQIGRCFKYRDSYSHDPGHWWIYAKATHLEGDALLMGWSFQRNIHDKCTIQYDEMLLLNAPDFGLPLRWQPISQDEFEAAWHEFIAKINEKADALL